MSPAVEGEGSPVLDSTDDSGGVLDRVGRQVPWGGPQELGASVRLADGRLAVPVTGFEREPDAGVGACAGLRWWMDRARRMTAGSSVMPVSSLASRMAASRMCSPSSRWPLGEASGFPDSRTIIDVNSHPVGYARLTVAWVPWHRDLRRAARGVRWPAGSLMPAGHRSKNACAAVSYLLNDGGVASAGVVAR